MPEKILFVDDEVQVLEGFQRLLRNTFQIETAAGAAEALKKLRKSKEYAVVVCDMRMSEMDGVHLLQKIKTDFPDVVRLMLTGNSDQQTAVEAVNEGNIFRGVDVMVAQTVITEVGLDMSPWKTEAHFASWLGVCPDNRISGDKVLARGTRHVLNRAATALRLGASTLLKSQTYLGAQYRRLRSKLGAPKAITAMAHRLARLVYRMLKYGQHYVDKGAEYYERRNRQQQIEFVRKKAAQLGLKVTPAHA